MKRIMYVENKSARLDGPGRIDRGSMESDPIDSGGIGWGSMESAPLILHIYSIDSVKEDDEDFSIP